MIFFIDMFHLRLYDVKLETTLELQADIAFSIASIRSVRSVYTEQAVSTANYFYHLNVI